MYATDNVHKQYDKSNSKGPIKLALRILPHDLTAAFQHSDSAESVIVGQGFCNVIYHNPIICRV